MTSTTSTSSTGPELLTERSIGGIFVHILSLFTGIIGAGLVYLISNNEFTRTNARNALNWHVTVLVLSIITVPVFFLGSDQRTIGGQVMEGSLLPAPLDTVFAIVGFILLVLMMIAWLLTVVFALVATVKAIFGTVWTYPFARKFVEHNS